MQKRPIIRIQRWTRPWTIYGPFTIFRASKSGGPLLKENVRRFHDINGFMIQTRRYRIQVEFRRRGGK
jgi:hypothetical protein